MKYFKWSLLAVAVIAAGYLNFSVFSWKGSVKEIESLCEKVPSGSDFSVVQNLVESSGSLDISGPTVRDDKDLYLVHSMDNKGGGTCSIETANGLVVSAKFDQLD